MDRTDDIIKTAIYVVFFICDLSMASFFIYSLVYQIRKAAVKRRWEKSHADIAETGTISKTSNHKADMSEALQKYSVVFLLSLILMLFIFLSWSHLNYRTDKIYSLAEGTYTSLEYQLSANIDEIKKASSIISSIEFIPQEGSLDSEGFYADYIIEVVPKQIADNTEVTLVICGEEIKCEREGFTFYGKYRRDIKKNVDVTVTVTTNGIRSAEDIDSDVFPSVNGFAKAYTDFIPSVQYASGEVASAGLFKKTLSLSCLDIYIREPKFSDVKLVSCELCAEAGGDIVGTWDIMSDLTYNNKTSTLKLCCESGYSIQTKRNLNVKYYLRMTDSLGNTTVYDFVLFYGSDNVSVGIDSFEITDKNGNRISFESVGVVVM